MNRNTVEVFHALMKKGWIDRRDDAEIWSLAKEQQVQEELVDFKAVIGFETISAGDRIYLVPTQNNDLFLQNNWDFRKDVRADSSIRVRDIYLFNYLTIYLIYLFFGGEGLSPLRQEFISKQDFIAQFTDHCKVVEQSETEAGEENYSDNFHHLAAAWLSKIDGDSASQKLDQKYGILNRILGKYKKDNLFVVGEDDLIRPTRKLIDLMPYFLRKERISEIHNWIQEASQLL